MVTLLPSMQKWSACCKQTNHIWKHICCLQTASCLLVPPSRGCLRLGPRRKHIFQLKRSHKMSIEVTYVFYGAIMDAWSWKIMIKHIGNHKTIRLEHVYMKVTTSVQIDDLRVLILMLPLAWNHSFRFSRFAQSVPNLVAESRRNRLLWVPTGAQR